MSDKDKFEAYERLNLPGEVIASCERMEKGVSNLLRSLNSQYPKPVARPTYPEADITPITPVESSALTSEQMVAQARQVIDKVAA